MFALTRIGMDIMQQLDDQHMGRDCTYILGFKQNLLGADINQTDGGSFDSKRLNTLINNVFFFFGVFHFLIKI